MRNIILLVNIFLLITTLASCSGSKKSKNSKTNEKLKNTKTKEEVIKQIKIEKEYTLPEKLDYTINSVVLTDGIFEINVTYKGGCGEHNFELLFNQMYAKSLPVQATLYLKHNPANETCSQEISKTLRFFANNVRHPQNKTVICKVYSFEGKFTYEY